MHVRLFVATAVVIASFWGAALVLLTVDAAPAGASTVALSVHDFAFSPTPLTVPVGTTVTVTNSGPTMHTWTSDPGSGQHWNSGTIAPGASFSVTFNQAGTFTYHCDIHPFMTGTIMVTGAAPATTTPVQAPPTTIAPTLTTTPGTPTTARTAPSGAAAVASSPTTAVQATALPRTGAAHTGVVVAMAVALTLVGVALAVSGAYRRRRIGD